MVMLALWVRTVIAQITPMPLTAPIARLATRADQPLKAAVGLHVLLVGIALKEQLMVLECLVLLVPIQT